MTAKDLKIKDDWLDQSRKMLKEHPEMSAEFDQLWNSGKHQEAYLFMRELAKNASIARSDEFDKINEQFYWLLR